LAACYAAALPFFQKQAVSEVVFTAVMFTVPAVIELVRPQAVKA
jgi:hypothetical protein